MHKKVVVVCTNPWETFLPVMSQGNSKKYYEWLQEQAFLREIHPYCKESKEIYGDVCNEKQEEMFLEETEEFQFLYVETKQEELLKKVLSEADFILVGMPVNQKECDRIYLQLLPWIEKCILVWDGRMGHDKAFYQKVLREYKLRDIQIMEINKLPSF